MDDNNQKDKISVVDLNFRKKLAKCSIWSTALGGAETWDTSESRSEIRGKFWNLLEKYGKIRTDRVQN